MITIASITAIIYASNLNNPINICISIILASSIIILTINLYNSNSWIPLSILILFLGGIIIIFIMLSSTIPNQNAGNSANVEILTLTAWFITLNFINPVNNMEITTSHISSIKTVLEDASSISSMTIIIILYFGVYTFLLHNNNLSLRST